MMDRMDALKVIAGVRTDEVVVATMGAMREWPRLFPHPLNFQVATAMGFASSVGLGIALARPDKKVVVLDGDGSLLMNLGSLVTVSNLSPSNLLWFVLENGLYEIPGRVPLPGHDRISIPGLARAAGLPSVYEFDKVDAFRDRIGKLLQEPGPVFVSLKIAPGPREKISLLPSLEMARTLEKALSK